MAFKRETDVLVVGAGPVGLFAALSLVERGLDVEVIDKEWRGAAHSQALALHPESLRLLDDYGVTDALLEEGHRVERLVFYDGHERAGVLDLSALGSPFPFVLVVPQSAVERALAERLEQKKVRIYWNHQCLATSQDERGVGARVARLEKYSMGYPIAHTEWMVSKEYPVRASFVLGADGYHSTVRKNLGARYEHRGETEAYSVYEFPSEIGFAGEACVVFEGGRVNAAWPLHGRGGRWSFQVDAAAPPPPTPEGLHELIRARARWFEPRIDELVWTATATFERRLVDRFGHDRVWLAGDAAHLTGPIGAQSMNVGLREAHDVAERFSAILKSGDSPARMEDYGRERLEEWQRLLDPAAAVRATAGAPAWARDHAPRILSCLPASGDALRRLLGQIGLELA